LPTFRFACRTVGQTLSPADWEATLRGSRVELLLKSDHVLFRSLDFPRQAADFLDGMIRAQIDRLTPWSANDAVFGWGRPATLQMSEFS